MRWIMIMFPALLLTLFVLGFLVLFWAYSRVRADEAARLGLVSRRERKAIERSDLVALHR